MSVGWGASKGRSAGSQRSEAADQLQSNAAALFSGQVGLRQDMTNSLLKLLKDKGQTPYTTLDPSGAEDASRYAESKVYGDTQKTLGRQGLLGTPFGEGILANQRAESEFKTSQIAPAYKNESLDRSQQSYQAILNLISQQLLGTQQNIMSGLGAAVPGNVSAVGGSTGFSGGMKNTIPIGK